jgi:hypothetical protein
VCASTTNCDTVVNRVAMLGREALDLGSGQVQISRNGRWALIADLWESIYTLVELATGQRTSIPYYPASDYGSISPPASDGSLLLVREFEPSPGELHFESGLWKQGQFRPLVAPDGLMPFRLTEDAATVLAKAFPPELTWSPDRIVAVSLATQRVTTIAEVTRPGHWAAIFVCERQCSPRTLDHRIGRLSEWAGSCLGRCH